ncbi:MAG: UDP-N-acetylmuramoyl-L-alanyl-D-glutamate--2,6-diaminopimelate ligase [Patescibacteria group bacterium]
MWQRIKNIYHLGNAFLANLWFGFPSRYLTVIGVTGTDGKTTTVSLIYHILHQAGYNVSMISSVGAVIGGKDYDVGFHVTTPSASALQGFINKALRSLRQFKNFSNASVPAAHYLSPRDTVVFGDSSEKFSHAKAPRALGYLILEVTSHAIDQNRIWGIPFDIAVLTNITHEHLDYHKTYENYVETKAKLLKMARVAVVNRDDESYNLIKSKVQFKSKKFVTYGMGRNAEVNPKTFPFKTNLIGEFNKYNVLAAVAACRELRISDQFIREALLTFKPPIGREEIVYKDSFTVMIDFAHTPNAFEEILSSIKSPLSPRLRRTRGRIIHVFGSAGERDASKRPLMGRVSAKYADVIVLTAEDPRSENVEKIMSEISSGIQNSKLSPHPNPLPRGEREKGEGEKKYLFKISDRKKAIEAAIKMARKGDFVLVTGKSHEKSMNYGKGEVPWDEYEAVRNSLRLRKIKNE